MKKWRFSLSIFLFVCVTCLAQQRDESAIRKILSSQIEAWNNGQLTEFMEGYWNNDSLIFIGKSGVTKGWSETLERYKKIYPDTVSMGKLAFEILKTERLSEIYFFVIGKWHLTRSVGNLEGHFSLLFKKINNEWFIIADHSS